MKSVNEIHTEKVKKVSQVVRKHADIMLNKKHGILLASSKNTVEN